jgi:hypothetical protein
MDLPPFDIWVPWEERRGVRKCRLPGVYILGRFHEAPPENVNPIAAEVVYIGETCMSLISRWRQFHRAAFRRGNDHSGGCTFATIFCDNQVIEPFDWLYVAACPVEMDEPRRSSFIRFIERRLIWSYVDLHGRLPCCNIK